MKRLLFSLLMVGAGLTAVTPAVAATTSSGVTFTPEVSLPGFTGPQEVNDDFIGTYVKVIYTYFVWVVGIIATVMVIFGGIRWVTASGNPGQVAQARDIINNAIIGIIIALVSVVLLNLISPQFTSLGLPEIKQAQQVKPGFATYNDAYKCFENLTCPTGMTQVSSGACYGGAKTLVNPGKPSCAANIVKGICCQLKDTNTCYSYSAKDLSNEWEGTCNQVPLDPNTLPACTDTTSCGSLSDDGKGNPCLGVSCPVAGKVCNITGRYTGNCVPTNGTDQVFSNVAICIKAGTPQFQLFFDSNLDCGKVVNLGDAPVYGTKDTCGSNAYCALAGFGDQCQLLGPRTLCKTYDLSPTQYGI